MIAREEAIEIFEQKGWWIAQKETFTSKQAEEIIKLNDAVNFALSSLRPVSREQVEKVWRGEWEWYDEEIGSPLEGIEREWGWRCSKCKAVLPDDFDDPDNPPAMRFCQWCGAPMTDEAVDMVMERMEAMHNDL